MKTRLESGRKIDPTTGVSRKYSMIIIHFPLPSHGDSHFANLRISEDIFHGYKWGPWDYVQCGTFTENAGIVTINF